MSDNEKYSVGEGFVPQTEFGKKLDNFWYYNKWKVIAAVFVLFVLTVCLIQCATQEKYAVKVVYAGQMLSSDQRAEAMKQAFSDIKPDSIGNGNVGFDIAEVYDDSYLQDANNSMLGATSSSNYKTFCNLIVTGEYSLLIVDKWIYDDIKGSVGFRSIDEVCGKIAYNSADGFSVKFKDTDFYKKNASVFSGISDDAVICLCIYSPYKSTMSCSSTNQDAEYTAAVEMFKSVLNYKLG